MRTTQLRAVHQPARLQADAESLHVVVKKTFHPMVTVSMKHLLEKQCCVALRQLNRVEPKILGIAARDSPFEQVHYTSAAANSTLHVSISPRYINSPFHETTDTLGAIYCGRNAASP